MPRSSIIRATVLTMMILVPAGPAVAETDSTAWDETDWSRVRLVAGGALEAGAAERLAGIDIRLAPGWKTYWRIPGDAGVPPVFDWSGSTNVADVDVALPVPGRYVDAYATAIGYEGEVVFPVVVTPMDPARTAVVRLAFKYAVCKEICLPVESEFTLELDGDASTSNRALIEAYRAKVPMPGTGKDSGIVAVAAEGEGAETRLLVDIRPVAPGVVPDVFVEGPDNFYFGTPKSAPANGILRLTVPVDGVTAKHPLSGETLRLTVVNGTRLVEQTVSVP